MNRDEILAKSRAENEKKDEREKHLTMIGRNAAWWVGGIMLIFLKEWADSEAVRQVSGAIFWAMVSANGIAYCAAREEEGRKYTVYALLHGALFLWSVIRFVKYLGLV